MPLSFVSKKLQFSHTGSVHHFPWSVFHKIHPAHLAISWLSSFGVAELEDMDRRSERNELFAMRFDSGTCIDTVPLNDRR